MSSHDEKFSRRGNLRSALAAGGVSLAGGAAVAEEVTPTPECKDSDEPTILPPTH